MTLVVSDYPSVVERAAAMGCDVPIGLAILPENFDRAEEPSDLIYAATSATVRTLLRINQISLVLVRPNSVDRLKQVSLKSADWLGPTLFISAAMMSDNGNAVSVALGMISNYLTDFFRGRGTKPEVRLSFVVEHTPNRHYKHLRYEGPVEGIPSLADAIRAVSNE